MQLVDSTNTATSGRHGKGTKRPWLFGWELAPPPKAFGSSRQGQGCHRHLNQEVMKLLKNGQYFKPHRDHLVEAFFLGLALLFSMGLARHLGGS